MKHISTILVLLMIGSMIAIDLYSEFKTQNILSIEVNPKQASTVFIEMDEEPKVETWDEEHILFQIFVESFPERSEVFNFLENNKKTIIQQEFNANDHLFLTISDLNKMLKINDSNLDEMLSYKITVPNDLDLNLWCRDDLSDFVDFQENPED